MIKNSENVAGWHLDDTEVALDFIKSHNLPFYITGSRFFGGAKPESGYDFFCTKNNIYCTELEACGFKEDYENDDHYVYETFKVYRMGNVQVRLVLDADKKNLIQKLIADEFKSFSDLPKNQRDLLWRLAYHAYNTGYNSF